MQAFYHAKQANGFPSVALFKFRSSRPEGLYNDSGYKNFGHFSGISPW